MLFAVERCKAWRMLQSKAGVVNKDNQAQKALLVKPDKGELQLAEVQAKMRELFDAELANHKSLAPTRPFQAGRTVFRLAAKHIKTINKVCRMQYAQTMLLCVLCGSIPASLED